MENVKVEHYDKPGSVREDWSEWLVPLEGSQFGLNLQVPANGADMILVALHKPDGYVPVLRLLKHQLYTHTVRELLAQHPSATGVSCYPLRSAERVQVFQEKPEATAEKEAA